MSSKTWWIVGGFATFVVGLGVLSARSAQAGTRPPDPIIPPARIPLNPRPVVSPQPAPRLTPAVGEIVRQGSLDAPTSPAVVRILQSQLKQLGYAITNIDGRPGPELQRATMRFEDDHALSHFTPNLELLLAVDSWYGRVFDPYNVREY